MMRIAAALGVFGLAASLATSASGAIYLSVDRFSPIISPGGVTPADVVISTPSGVRVEIRAASLGLQNTFDGLSYEGDDLNAMSFGRDALRGALHFSVDRLSLGLPGTAVRQQTSEGDSGAAGDIFLALPDSDSNRLLIAEIELGLTPGAFGDDLNGLSMVPPVQGVYFSMDLFSASNDFGAGDLASTIFLNDLGTVFASAQDLGILPGDDIDGLLLWDVFEPGVLNPGIDVALFSISRDSLSAITMGGTVGPADVLFTDFSGTFSVRFSAASLGLSDTDDLNALFVASAEIPEPGSCCCWLLAVGGVLACRRWRGGQDGCGG